MRQELYSVEQVAEQLGLHVRTIRNYVRDGKLKATRIGKQYRITREDLEEFTGTSVVAPGAVADTRHAEVSSIVQIDGVDRPQADRITTYVTASINQGGMGRLRVELAYDETRGVLKIIILGDLDITADVLRLIDVIVTS